MDEETLKIVLTALITSGFTIILSRIFDFLKQRSEYNLNLKQHFFEKRLENAENIVEYLNKKADKFDHLGTVLRKIDFIKNDGVELKNKTGNSMDWIFDTYIDYENIDEIFEIEIPPKAYLYFNLNGIKNPRKEFDKKNTDLIHEFKKLDSVFSNFNVPNSDELEKIKELSEEERNMKAAELLMPLVKLQINFSKWAETLFETRNDLQTISLKIEKEFYKFH